MVSQMPGAVALRAVAEAEDTARVKVREVGGNNRGKWVEMYQKVVGIFRGDPWCMAFVVFRLLDAAQDLGVKVRGDMPRTGYTPTFANWGKSQNLWISAQEAAARPATIQRGDIVFFYRVGLGRICHTGHVAHVFPWGVETIEGNTGPDGGRDGDGVYRKARTWAELGAKGGFVRLPF